MKKAIGVDIGGTKIAAAIVYEDGSLAHEVKVSSDTSSREKMYASLCLAIDQVLEQSQLKDEAIPFGIGVPGLVDRNKGIAIFQNNLPWDNFPIVERLIESYENCQKVVVDNDVYQAAYAEWKAANLSAEDTMIYLTISTGISSAILKGGKFLRGKGFAGEVGLLLMYSPEAGYSTLEKLASGPALAEKGREVYNDGTIDAREIFARYYQEEALATALINNWADDLVLGLHALICILDPQKIILGGSVIINNPGILDLLKTKLENKLIAVQKDRVEVLELSKYPNNAGIIGAGLSSI